MVTRKCGKALTSKMKDIIVVCLLALVAGASAQCGKCASIKWGTCEGAAEPCTCTLLTGITTPPNKQSINCGQLVPKCFLMKAEMYRARNNLSTRSIGGKPVTTAILDNDGIYDPECENDGRFKAIQCNNTETCWCVNSAGVRRSDKGDKNLKCEPAETYWLRLELTHKPVNTTLDLAQLKTGLQNSLFDRYSLDRKNVVDVQYDANSRFIVVDLKKDQNDRAIDLPRMAYYLEKDVKALPLFTKQEPFLVSVNSNPVEMEKILVYYVDDKAPTITMQKLTGGVISVIVVVILVVLVGLLILYFIRRKEKARYNKTPARELEPMS
ncbi:hypothetical protein AMELA_G00048510 [Ameiurus melas]|uniref:Thyroglobulin type-1 domain-containing protein n=1 Tax=Ameiurus melas TaxID=219545 RepID=A0A7J6B4U8_AMEME|nr:hypothetical protein AMELA_G00048510 [Ameiurus melas]